MTSLSRLLSETAALTLRDPRAAARKVISLPLGAREWWTALSLTIVASILALEAFVALAPGAADPAMAMLLANPLAFAAMQLVGAVVTAGLIHTVSRRFGGTGGFIGGVAIMVWIQVLLLALQLGQIVALLLLPPLVGILALTSLGLLVWLLPNFIAELHGFRSAFLTFLGMVGTFLGVVLLMSFILVFVFGMGVPGNV